VPGTARKAGEKDGGNPGESNLRSHFAFSVSGFGFGFRVSGLDFGFRVLIFGFWVFGFRI